MPENDEGPKIQVDSDWKAEAQQEKERLANEEKKVTEAGAQQAALGNPTFAHLINLVGMQAVIALGGLRGPGGESMPPDPEAARFHIDMLEMIEEKTAGNLTEEETKILSGTLHELRMMYVQIVNTIARGAAGEGGPQQPA